MNLHITGQWNEVADRVLTAREATTPTSRACSQGCLFRSQVKLASAWVEENYDEP
jgi:hypothetical protein